MIKNESAGKWLCGVNGMSLTSIFQYPSLNILPMKGLKFEMLV